MNIPVPKHFNKKLGLMLPLILLITAFLWLAPADIFGIDGLTVVEQRTIAIFVFTALMWMFEVIPGSALHVCRSGHHALPRRIHIGDSGYQGRA